MQKRGWVAANLFAVYVMPGEEPAAGVRPAAGAGPRGAEALKRIRTDLDGVRAEALGFIEFEGGGLPIRDGQTAGLEIELVR